MPMEWVGPSISGVTLIVVAIIEWAATRERKRAKEEKEKQERRAERRAEESRLSMDLSSAICALAKVTAKKVTGQHVNGDLSEAMEKADEAQEEYIAFVRKTAAEQVTK